MSEPGFFARHETEPHERESCMPSFMGLGLGMRAPKRALSELGVSLFPCRLPLHVPVFMTLVSLADRMGLAAGAFILRF